MVVSVQRNQELEHFRTSETENLIEETCRIQLSTTTENHRKIDIQSREIKKACGRCKVQQIINMCGDTQGHVNHNELRIINNEKGVSITKEDDIAKLQAGTRPRQFYFHLYFQERHC